MEKKQQDILAKSIIGAVALLGIGISLVLIFGTRDPIDPEDNCPVNKEVRYPTTSIILDSTDPYSPTQAEFIHSFTEELLAELTTLERVRVFTVTDEAFSPRPIFDRCNPGSPETANPLYQNPKMIRAEFESKFRDPLNSSLASAHREDALDTSPIMETLREANRRYQLDSQSTEHRLIIISDLLQNVPAYSHYRHPISFDDFRAMPYFREVEANLIATDVEIVYIHRPRISNSFMRDHLDFWSTFLKNQGATVVGITEVR